MRVATASTRASHLYKTPAKQMIPPTHMNNLSIPMVVGLAAQITEKRCVDDAAQMVILLLNATLGQTRLISSVNPSNPTKV
jgi:hypothetical protein